jgi:G:T-mismatch repair DNA endonuclease (very short patch repair protein)
MPDIFSPEKRTDIMRSVRNKNTLPELIVQSLLRDIGIEYEREKSCSTVVQILLFRI